MQNRRIALNGIRNAIILGLLIAGVAALADSPKPTVKSRINTPAAVTSDIGILGFRFAISDKHVPEIAQVFPDTPAAKYDLRKGDVVSDVNGVQTKNLDKEKIYQLLSGKPDTKVILKIQRGDITFTKNLTRIHSAAFAQAHPDVWKLYLSTM